MTQADDIKRIDERLGIVESKVTKRETWSSVHDAKCEMEAEKLDTLHNDAREIKSEVKGLREDVIRMASGRRAISVVIAIGASLIAIVSTAIAIYKSVAS